MPIFNQLTGNITTFGLFVEPTTLLAVIGATIFIGLMAGIYPSFILSSFNTIKSIEGQHLGFHLETRDVLRSGLVVFQFAVSTSLIVATLIVYQQLNFIQNKNLGYNKDQVSGDSGNTRASGQ